MDMDGGRRNDWQTATRYGAILNLSSTTLPYENYTNTVLILYTNTILIPPIQYYTNTITNTITLCLYYPNTVLILYIYYTNTILILY